MADSLDSGFPRGAKAPCWHTILLLQSLVCYTFCDRGWLKGVDRWRSKHFEVAAGQADFESFQFRNSGFAYTKSDCPGVGDAAYFFCITGGVRGISHSRPAIAPLSFLDRYLWHQYESKQLMPDCCIGPKR